MRPTIVAIALAAFIGGLLGSALGEAQARKLEKHPQRSAKYHGYRANSRGSERQPSDGYMEMRADKMPFGSNAWWDQMQREGRLGGETP
jgi:hypothetical protein